MGIAPEKPSSQRNYKKKHVARTAGMANSVGVKKGKIFVSDDFKIAMAAYISNDNYNKILEHFIASKE